MSCARRLARAGLGWAVLGGAAVAGIYTIVMSIVLVRQWDDAHALGRMGLLYLHNDNFAPKAMAYLDRAIAMSPNDGTAVQPARRRLVEDGRVGARRGRLAQGGRSSHRVTTSCT